MAFRSLTVWYRLSDDTVEGMVVVRRERRSGQGWLLRAASGDWMPEGECFLTRQQCQAYYGMIDHGGERRRKQTLTDLRGASVRLADLSEHLDRLADGMEGRR